MYLQNRLLKEIKYSFQSYSIRNDKQSAWRLFKKFENLIRYHSMYRFKSLLKYLYWKQKHKISALGLSKGINNGVFYLLLDERNEKEKRVIKIPRFNNRSSRKLLNLMRDQEKFRSGYKERIMALTQDIHLGSHLPEVFKIEPDGTYISSFIDGFNLREIKQQIINGTFNTDTRLLKNAIAGLAEDIKNFKNNNGKIIGDWGAHNLLYNPGSDKIYNVDLEGFCLYDDASIESNSEYIAAELNSSLDLISLAENENELLDLFHIINEKTIKLKSFSGASFFTGYQSVTIKNYFFNGKKNSEKFIESLPVDFKGKKVLDIGSFWGSLLSVVSPVIEAGYGIDKDEDCIKVSEKLAEVNQKRNIHFYKYDIERSGLKNFLKSRNVNHIDIIFILNLLNELSDPEKLIKESSSSASEVIFELTGNELLRKKQSVLVSKYFKNIKILNYNNEEWWFNKNSEILICSN